MKSCSSSFVKEKKEDKTCDSNFLLESQVVECSTESFMHKDYRS